MRYPAIDHLRLTLRAKAARVVDEVVGRYHRRQADQIDTLRAETRELHEELRAVRRELAETRDEADRMLQAIAGFEHRARRDLAYHDEYAAAMTSAEFARAVMGTVPTFPHPLATLEHGLSLAAEVEGMALEFGVFGGTTLKVIAAAREGREVYGFDSFQGLPEDWRTGFPAGSFDRDQLPDVPGAELVVGWFDDTLPSFVAEHEGPVAFLHLDADLYSSTRTVLRHVGPRLRVGSVVVFDEFFNYPGWQHHEYRAWQEYVAESGIEFRYEGYTVDNEQVIARITGM
ncbi:Macrocin-O-methyltransferase (TylF) [Streptoalloteichus tenebrarius]|uniref:Macrocin-O-methyltransferase (TylF) n=1 Tax=Streptoalloteichus tenebrarius (strain ATCC 17920 / DSM 40477 / JCM 4838 / CBS 697.72 / NBRC 16177 / NCIMB 11028 / NRRL B-12390 / A12253. 1 / ISP 5477) TaxID=1933 RepID=A0ABT1HRF3_STRSD|nr:TylF/MycF/NovP-related O-methyltransferase [Streptoalloteichus tenebrarius]MCP2258104.1 Macrocin-O-methyltransferase (TylF) [Streptoalloteichus tenebrarius]BFF01778.1 class I SAM-dependent methyltransferase [Streptoalloteichus tenebrarius]